MVYGLFLLGYGFIQGWFRLYLGLDFFEVGSSFISDWSWVSSGLEWGVLKVGFGIIQVWFEVSSALVF